MDSANLDNIVLALLFSADEPLSVRKIASVLEKVPADDIKRTIERWGERLDDEAWSVAVETVAGGYQLSSRPEYAPYIARLYTGRRKLRLSRAALETLAIVAYKQPITRAEIENIRGVGCGSVVSNLMERSLIRITGKAKVLGAPFLYGTTQEFLEYLGLNSLKELPSHEELEALLEREEAETEGELEGKQGAADVAGVVGEQGDATDHPGDASEAERPQDTPLSELEDAPDDAGPMPAPGPATTNDRDG
jgi:segregation and condensation protein B